jgi:L-alanine-DL-glutamate epimerase-like enolase superfamily enzyme
VKIVDGRTTVVGTPRRELTFVEVETDDGLVGTGEVRMVNKMKTLVACIEALEGPLRASRLKSISGHLARIGAIDDVIDQHARIFERVRDRDSKGAR